MTTIFKMLPIDHGELCRPLSEEDESKILGVVSGAADSTSWEAPNVRLVKREDGTTLDFSHCPWSGTSQQLYVRPEVIERMGDWLEQFGDFLPLRASEPLWFFHVTRELDALDRENSKFHVLRSSGLINGVTRFQFKEEVLLGTPLFRLSGLRASRIFVSAEFVERWRSADLVGLEFKEVWSS